MQSLKRLLLVSVLLVVLVFGVLFSFQNTEQVALDLLVIKLPSLPVAFWVLSALAIGGLGGVLISTVTFFRLKSQAALLQRKVDKQQKELAKYRAHEAKTPLIAKADKS